MYKNDPFHFCATWLTNKIRIGAVAAVLCPSLLSHDRMTVNGSPAFFCTATFFVDPPLLYLKPQWQNRPVGCELIHM